MGDPPLKGLRIVELAGIGPGPFAGMMLADHGADVIRIDRGPKPGFTVDALDPLLRSRRSITLDLKQPQAVAAVRRIAARADGLIEGSPPRVGNAHMNVSPYAVFPSADGWFILAVGNDAQYRRFCRVVGFDPDDPAYATNALRIENRAPLFAAIEAATRRFARDDLLARLEEAGVPVGPINTVEQAFADPQVRHRGMAVEVEREDGTMLPGLRTPIRFSDAELAIGRAAPSLPTPQPSPRA